MRTIIPAIFIISIFFIGACSKHKEIKTSTVRIVFENNKSLEVNKDWGLTDPTASADYTCFAVFVDYPEEDKGNICELYNSTLIIARPDEVHGLVPIGGEIFLDVKIGFGRIFKIMGFKTTVGCHPVLEQWDAATEAGMSNPYIIGQTQIDIAPGPQTVNIAAGHTGAQKVGECYGPFFNMDELFKPINISDSYMWLDGNDNNGADDGPVGDNPGGGISTWTGKVASRNAVGASTSVVTANFGIKGSISFDGTVSYMDTGVMTTGLSAASFFVVFYPVSGTDTYLFGARNGSDMLGLKFNTGPDMLIPCIGSASGSGGLIVYGTRNVAAFRYNGSDLDFYLNGTLIETITSYAGVIPSSNNIYLGCMFAGTCDAGTFYDGQIAEFIIYERSLLDDEMDKVHGYLKQKWGTL